MSISYMLILRKRINVEYGKGNDGLIQLIGTGSINSAKMPVVANDLVSFMRYFTKVENELLHNGIARH